MTSVGLGVDTPSPERSVDLTGVLSGPQPRVPFSTKTTSPFRLTRVTVEGTILWVFRGHEMSNT